MNAPFNPVCFCKAEEYHDNSQENSPAELSPHVMDAARYLDPGQLYKILEGEKRKSEIVIGMMPNFYNMPCSICSARHPLGQECATLKNNLPNNGEFI
jgi:hypothetical protein